MKKYLKENNRKKMNRLKLSGLIVIRLAIRGSVEIFLRFRQKYFWGNLGGAAKNVMLCLRHFSAKRMKIQFLLPLFYISTFLSASIPPPPSLLA